MRKALLLLPLTPLLAHAQHVITNQHIDFATNYNPTLGQWQLTLRDEDIQREFAGRTAPGADRVIIQAGLSARVEVPNIPGFSFLGSPATSVWVMPQTQDPELPYIGVSTENLTLQGGWSGDSVSSQLLVRGVSSGVFSGNQITLRLSAISGPGNFFLYSTDFSGQPVISMNTSDGLSTADARVFSPGTHSHFNWAFTAPGTYDLTFVASGVLASSGTLSQSTPTTFRFAIVPEPATAGLLGVGALLLASRRRSARPSVSTRSPLL